MNSRLDLHSSQNLKVLFTLLTLGEESALTLSNAPTMSDT